MIYIFTFVLSTVVQSSQINSSENQTAHFNKQFRISKCYSPVCVTICRIVISAGSALRGLNGKEYVALHVERTSGPDF